MGVSVPTITTKYPVAWPSGATAEDLVTEKFEQTAGYADSAFATAEAALRALADLFPVSFPRTVIDYDYVDASLGAEIGKAPTAPSISITKPNPPSIGPLENVTIPSISIPDPPGDPAASFIYNEANYQSQLLIDLKAALLAYVQDGGTGLAADVEAAIWARARARKDLQNEKVYDEALNFFAARGFALPPGVLGGRLTEALAEQTRADAQINYEVMIEQARLAQTNTHFTITSSIQLEGQEREYFDKIANRAFEKAKTVVDVIINLYNTKMQGYIAKMEGKKIEADVAKTRGALQISKNENTVAVFEARINRYEVELKSEIGIAETIGKIYGYKVAGYEAKARVAIADLNAQVEIFKGRVAQSDNQTKLTIAEATMTLGAYIEAAKMQAAAAEGAANISAQLAASALSAVNATATLGHSTSLGRNDGVTSSTSVSGSQILTEEVEHD